jgi:putative membrane protein
MHRMLLAQSDFPGVNGFLGTRGSLMLDVVFLAMFAVVPAMAVSIFLVKFRRQYALHRGIQTTLGAVLLVAVLAFEIDMRIHGWRARAEPSPYFAGGGVHRVLYVHLFFAIPTVVLWAYVIIDAWRKFPSTPLPGKHSPPPPGKNSSRHKFSGWIAAAEMTMTAVTGWVPSTPLPGKHSPRHKFWGWIAAVEMTMTAVTGWVFYWIAFVA